MHKSPCKTARAFGLKRGTTKGVFDVFFIPKNPDNKKNKKNLNKDNNFSLWFKYNNHMLTMLVSIEKIY